MPANKLIRLGPVALTTTLTTNLFNFNVTSLAGPVGFTLTQPYVIIRQLRVINKTGTNATVSLWLGASGANAAGTEVLAQGTTVPGNGSIAFPVLLRMDVADFLVGGAGTATALTLEAEAEIGFS